ncbi:MAG TPA: serine protease [Candidatus Polarisedimenticolia bacterium]|nr:serine protease [Candidatus Polarisedimenticolia bacterium]
MTHQERRPRPEVTRRSGAFRGPSGGLLFLAGVLLLSAAGVRLPGRAFAAEAGRNGLPMRVAAEGASIDADRQRQAELATRLLTALPARALDLPVRIEPSREEIRSVLRPGRPREEPLRIGIVKSLSARLDIEGLASVRRGAGGPAKDGGYEWAAAVVSSSAGAMRFHIEGLELPPGGELFVFSRTGEAFGPYTGNGPNDDGEFWTDTLFGGEAILQVHVPAPATPDDLAEVAFSVSEVGLVLPRFAGPATDAASSTARPPAGRGETQAGDASPLGIALQAPSGPFPCGSPACLVDATCPGTASAAALARNAVAKMEWPKGQFLYTCSGALINDANPERDNLFLTAAHCLDRNRSALNVQFYWRFATPSCNGACPANEGWPFRTAGATVVATGRRGDYTLLQLRTPPPSGSVFLGWSAEPVAGSDGLPLYRISNPDFGPQVFSRHEVDATSPMCGGWPRGLFIYSHDIVGAIDGGSSGSPLFNAQAQIVGQLSGSCGSDVADVCASGPGEANSTVDGAFAAYFPRLQPILAP